MVQKIDHIGIAVNSIDESIQFYINQFKLELEGIEEVPSEKVRVAFLRIGQSRLELLEPTSADSPIAAYIDKRGEGIHHIALAVESIEERIKDMMENGIQMIHTTPKIGAHGAKIAFLHPKSTGKVLYELCDRAEGDSHND